MLKPLTELSTFLANISFFNSSIRSQPSLAFWLQNLRQFGTINILSILGLDPDIRALQLVDVGESIGDPPVVCQVFCALDKYQEAEEITLATLLSGVGGTNSAQQITTEIRIMLYDRWRRIFRCNERGLYIRAMNTIFDGVQIWEVTMDITNPNLMMEEGYADYHIVPDSEDSGADDQSRGITTPMLAIQPQNMNADAFVPDAAE